MSKQTMDCQESNSSIWDSYYKTYQSDALVPGVKYPNEHLVTFIMNYKNSAAWPNNRRPRVLELGFGNITNMRMMADKGCDVLGLEVSDDSVKRARAAIDHFGLGEHLDVGSYMGPEIPCEDGEFDVIVGLQCVYYNVDQETFSRECARVLRPGGLLFLSLFTPDSGYMSYSQGEPGGVVSFREDHHNPRLAGLQLFLYRNEAQFEETYGRYFDLSVGRIETNLYPDFHSWYYVRGQKSDAAPERRLTFNVAKPENAKEPELLSEPANASELAQENHNRWNDFVLRQPEQKPFSGLQYPSERLLCFLATWKRRHSEHFFSSAIGKEEEFAQMGGLRSLEIDFLNPVMHEAQLHFGYTPCGVSFPEAVRRGQESLECMGMADKVNYKEWDGIDLPYEDDIFDVAFGLKAAYYHPNQEHFVKEVARVVKPGGECFFNYMTPRMGYQAYMRHVSGNVYRFDETHPDPNMVGMHVFYAGEEALNRLWEPYFDVEVKYVDFSAYKFYSSFYVVTGRRLGG